MLLIRQTDYHLKEKYEAAGGSKWFRLASIASRFSKCRSRNSALQNCKCRQFQVPTSRDRHLELKCRIVKPALAILKCRIARAALGKSRRNRCETKSFWPSCRLIEKGCSIQRSGRKLRRVASTRQSLWTEP